MKQLSLIDWVILEKIYRKENWKENLFYITDFSDMSTSRNDIYYHLKKLSKDTSFNSNGLIKEHNSYPKYWTPIYNEILRKNILRMCDEVIKNTK